MIYTQAEADRKERMYNRRTERVAWLVMLIAVGTFGVGYGQYTQFELVTQIEGNAEYSTVLRSRALAICVATAARVMHEVLIVDAGLHQKIREMPPIKVQP